MKNRRISNKTILLFTIQPNVQTKWMIFPKKCKKYRPDKGKMMSRQAKKTNIITESKETLASKHLPTVKNCSAMPAKGCPAKPESAVRGYKCTAVPTPKLWVVVVAALPLGPRKTRRKILRASLSFMLAPSRQSLLVSLAHQQRTNKGCGNALQNTA